MVYKVSDLIASLETIPGFEIWCKTLPAKIAGSWTGERHGDLKKWEELYSHLPDYPPSAPGLDETGSLVAGEAVEPGSKEYDRIRALLYKLKPWRKGPFNVKGVFIDAEWKSNLKYDRLKEAVSGLDLQGGRILDVGSGNGYYMLRLLEFEPSLIVGVEPSVLYTLQFLAVKKYLTPAPAFIVPLALEKLPPVPQFDLVMSMGVLYHRKSPIEHLLNLKSFLAPGGKLVLETLYAEGEAGYSLVPPGRYAKMTNVWFLPSPDTLVGWLQKCGFKDVVITGTSTTTTEEQRATDWSFVESLPDYLDPSDSSKTVEGHPAPKRIIVTAGI